MHRPGIKERAIILYDSGLSCRAVSRVLIRGRGTDVSPQTIARWMREDGRSRPVGEPRSVELGSKARRLYESGLTIAQVAQRFGVGTTVTRRRLLEMGVEIRPRGSRFVHLLSCGRLQKLYVDDRRSLKSVATEFGCSIGTVHYWLKSYGIPRRGRGEFR